MDLTRPTAPDPYSLLPSLPTLQVSSDDLTDGGQLPEAQAFGGGNTSPQLSWSGAPEGTKSFLITCFDPDAPTPSGFWHWVYVGVPGSTTSLDAGAGTSASAGGYMVRNDFGTNDFGGAAPPPGDVPHRYIFAVTALDTDDLGLDESATPAVVHFTALGHMLARGTLTATYQVPADS